MKTLLCALFLTPAFAQTAPTVNALTLGGPVRLIPNAAAPGIAGPIDQPAEPARQKQAAAGVASAEQGQNQNQPPGAAPPANQNRPPANAAGRSRNRSVIKPKPGQMAIKPKDYQGATGYWHPFLRMPRFVGYDLKGIGTSPWHTSRKDAKWWLIFGGATGALISVDKYVSRNAPNPPWLEHLGNGVSYIGSAYTLLPISAAFYFGGTRFHSDHFRETGLIAFETLATTGILLEGMKAVFDRQRPLEGAGNGEFGAAKSRLDSSFPSGHAMSTFAMASVVAHEYPHKRWVQILAYSYASVVIGARLAANKHFPGDVCAGGAIGWFTGDYIYGKRHNPALDKKPTITQRIIDHIHIGGPENQAGSSAVSF